MVLPLEDLRLTLLKDTQEFESYETVAGNAVFENVAFGQYIIKIVQKNEELGAINLEIR